MMEKPINRKGAKAAKQIFIIARLKEALIYSSFPRRRESRYFKNLDSRLRGNDKRDINQGFLTDCLLCGLCAFAVKIENRCFS